MSTPSPLGVLVERAEAECDSALQAFATARQRQAATRQRSERLRGYRHEYRDKSCAGTRTGTTPEKMATVLAFLDSLDIAVKRTVEQLEQDAQRTAASRNLWTEKRRRLQSLRALIARRAEEDAEREKQKEQKASDEYAARSGSGAQSVGRFR